MGTMLKAVKYSLHVVLQGVLPERLLFLPKQNPASAFILIIDDTIREYLINKRLWS